MTKKKPDLSFRKSGKKQFLREISMTTFYSCK